MDANFQTTKREQALFKSIFNKSEDGMLIFDLNKSIFTSCNSAAHNLIGYQLQDIIGKTTADFSPVYQPDKIKSSEKMQPLIKKTLEQGANKFEWTLCHLNGQHISVDISIYNIEFGSEKIILIIWKERLQEKNNKQILKRVA
jgi:PAS domain S-box-containing protein